MRRPWNIIDTPVYSLATKANGQVNMNICTYVTAISMKPKMYAVALDPQTKTYENVCRGDRAVLQIMGQSQINLVNTLGRKSGLSLDKESYLERRNLLVNWKNTPVLREAAALISLEKLGSQPTGDHELFWFKTTGYRSIHENILMFQQLIANKVILT